MKKHHIRQWRGLACGLVIAAFAVGQVVHLGTGSLSSLGVGSISAVCPLGQLETMLTGQNINLHAWVMLALMVIAVVLLGKAFCSWLCPTPHLQAFFWKKKPENGKPAAQQCGSRTPAEEAVTAQQASQAQQAVYAAQHAPETVPLRAIAQPAAGGREEPASSGLSSDDSPAQPELTAAERAMLAGAVHGSCAAGGCAALKALGGRRDGFQLDSRHVVLVAALAAAAIFGIPVFCLVCPVGLTFASIAALIAMFVNHQFTWGVVVFPAAVVLEVVVLKKWCHVLCPMGALVSLISQANVTAKPVVDKTKCLRERGVNCSVCVETCPEQVDPHSRRIPECTKCGLCVEKCPAGAISFQLLPGRQSGSAARAAGSNAGIPVGGRE